MHLQKGTKNELHKDILKMNIFCNVKLGEDGVINIIL